MTLTFSLDSNNIPVLGALKGLGFGTRQDVIESKTQSVP